MKDSNMRKLSLSVIPTLLVALFSSAAMGQSLGLAPAEVRATFVPGQPIQFEVGVSNDGSDAVVMRATVNDFWYNDNSSVRIAL